MLSTNTSPARPTQLPADLLALTTATMVVPLPAALASPGLRQTGRATPRLFTGSVPPDLASRAEADLLSDTVEQFLGDLDAVGRELDAQRRAAAAAGARGAGVVGAVGLGGLDALRGDPRHRGRRDGRARRRRGLRRLCGLPGTSAARTAARVHPAGARAPRPDVRPGLGAGRYGVPTQFPAYDAARRSPIGMRYLGGDLPRLLGRVVVL